MGTKWIEYAVYTDESAFEAVSAVLMQAGIASLSVEESHENAFAELKESGVYWDFADTDRIGVDRPCVKGYVAEGPAGVQIIHNASSALGRLSESYPDLYPNGFETAVRTIDEEDWANNWKQYYKPLKVGSRILILPSWEELPDTDRIVLKLDPGMAFGTGTHPTTQMCLELLESALRNGDSLLDLGCGSGILSVAGRLLGADSAVAVDIDPISRSIVQENASMNQVFDEHFTILIGDILKDTQLQKNFWGAYDVITANIVADVILAIAPMAKSLLAENGSFIVSGIIDDRVEDVIRGLKDSSFSVIRQISREGWNAFLCK